MSGWEEQDPSDQYARAEKFQSRAGIAIKQMNSQGQTGIRFFNLRVINGTIMDANKLICTVDCVAVDLNHDIIKSRDYLKSIHLHFENDEWIEGLFYATGFYRHNKVHYRLV